MGVYDDLLVVESIKRQPDPPSDAGLYGDLLPASKPPSPKGGWEGAAETAAGVASTADDAARALADTVTYGTLDRVLGPEEVAKTLAARQRSPWATFSGDVAGSVMTPGAGFIGKTLGNALGGARAGFVPGLARSVGYGTEGAIAGGLQGAGHTYDWDKLADNMGTGATWGGAGGMVTGPIARVGRVPRAETPTTRELAASGDANYTRLHPQGWPATQYHPDRFFSAMEDVGHRLTRGGINPHDATDAHAALQLALSGRGQPGVAIDPSNMAAVWRQLSGAQAKGGAEARAAFAIKREIEAFMADPANIRSGTRAAAADAANTLQRANADWAARSRAHTIERANEEALRGAASSHSGLNYENSARQRIKNLLNTKGDDPLMGYSPPERQSVEDLVRRSNVPERMRDIGNLLGGGGGMGALVAGGTAGAVGMATSNDPQTAALMALGGAGLGRGLRVAGNRGMLREIDEATEALRQRSPLFYERQAATPGTMAGPGHRYTPTREASEGIKNAIVYEIMRQKRDDDDPLRITVNPIGR